MKEMPYLVFSVKGTQGLRQSTGALEVHSKGLLDNQAIDSLKRVTVLLQSVGDRNEDGGRQGHIEKSVMSLRLLLDSLQLLLEGLET